uniref:Uncharacterized protein n=1 Tax=Timspurckia oligopyrenoides TaxID=708627 RepID=A0A7S0ZL84_9RHOD
MKVSVSKRDVSHGVVKNRSRLKSKLRKKQLLHKLNENKNPQKKHDASVEEAKSQSKSTILAPFGRDFEFALESLDKTVRRSATASQIDTGDESVNLYKGAVVEARTAKSRRRLVKQHTEQLQNVLSHDAFKSKPMEALREHLINTVPGALVADQVPAAPSKRLSRKDLPRKAALDLIKALKDRKQPKEAHDVEHKQETDSEPDSELGKAWRNAANLRKDLSFKGERKLRNAQKRIKRTTTKDDRSRLRGGIAKRGVIGIPRPKIQ